MKEQETQARPAFTSHSISLSDRKRLTATGITAVVCATDGEVSLTSCMGAIAISGAQLKIVKFDETDGDLTMTGEVNAIKYTAAKIPLIKRIFK